MFNLVVHTSDGLGYTTQAAYSWSRATRRAIDILGRDPYVTSIDIVAVQS